MYHPGIGCGEQVLQKEINDTTTNATGGGVGGREEEIKRLRKRIRQVGMVGIEQVVITSNIVYDCSNP